VTTTPDRLNAALAGRYRIERELGAGGMATVWLAHDLKHDRKVAIKVLHPHLAALVGADRFLKEIKTTANLQHPHILPLHDSRDADGLLDYVMPFVDGESLRQRITRDNQLPIGDAVRIASEVAGALDYAHRQGEGSALVADFGIALAPVTGDIRLTETGMSLGTPHYMSPEQARGDRELDARTDIYAVGAMLYEMLTGTPRLRARARRRLLPRCSLRNRRHPQGFERTFRPISRASLSPRSKRTQRTGSSRRPRCRLPSKATVPTAPPAAATNELSDGRSRWSASV
jgi:serine/threonine protein kinase